MENRHETNICIINCGSDFIEDVLKKVEELGCSAEMISLDEAGKHSFTAYDGIVISGSPIFLTKTDPKKYLNTFKFVKKTNIPVLGICFGHQIIGLLYGAKIHATDEISKKEPIELVKADDLFADLRNRPLFQEEHTEHISLPEEFHLLARSETCDNEAMKHKYKVLYGVQFHPEISGNDGKTVLRNFVGICLKANSRARN